MTETNGTGVAQKSPADDLISLATGGGRGRHPRVRPGLHHEHRPRI